MPHRLLFLLLILLSLRTSGQQLRHLPAPAQLVTAPGIPFSTMREIPRIVFSPDRRFVAAISRLYINIWKFPEGSWFGGARVEPSRIYDAVLGENFQFSADSRLAYVQYPKLGSQPLWCLDLASGKRLRRPSLLDSLARNLYPLSASVVADHLSLFHYNTRSEEVLRVARPYPEGSDEILMIQKGAPNPVAAQELHMLFYQGYIGDSKWRRQNLTKQEQEWFKLNMPKHHYTSPHGELYVAAYDVATRTARPLGRVLGPGRNNNLQGSALLSPRYQVALVRHTAYSYAGDSLWQLRDRLEYVGVDTAGLFTFRTPATDTLLTIHPRTGRTLARYVCPPALHPHDNRRVQYFLDQQLYALLEKTNDAACTLGIYDLRSGQLVSALIDSATVISYGRAYDVALAAYKAQEQANIRAAEEKLRLFEARQQQEHERVQREKAEAERRSPYTTCPECQGTCGTYRQERRSHGSVTTSSTGRQTYTERWAEVYPVLVPCTYCKGEGRVLKTRLYGR